MASTAQQLPTAVLAQILQCVPLQQRLLGCAFVCKAWAAAAVTATSSISLRKSYVPNSLGVWMKKHGSKVGSLELELHHRIAKPETVEKTYAYFWDDFASPYCRDDSESQQEDSSDDAVDESADQVPLAMSAVPVDDGQHAALFKLLLPCAELQQLTRLSLESTAGLNRLQLDLDTQHQQGSSRIGDDVSTTAVLPKLVDLTLVNCSLASTDTMQKLFSTAAPQLTKLHIQQLSWPALHAGRPGVQHPLRDSYPTAQVVPSVLQRCSNLVTLHVLEQPLSSVDAQPIASPYASISRSQKLQELVLFWDPTAAALPLPTLPLGITHLGLMGARQLAEPLLLPQLPQLLHLRVLKLERLRVKDSTLRSITQLQSLQLKNVSIDAATLASMTQLQELVLHHCRVTSATRPQTSSDTVTPCLSALEQLCKLHVLEILQLVDIEHMLSRGAPALAAFSALTASSQLQRLRVATYNSKALPRGAFKHMFPAGRQLMHLVCLDIAHSDTDSLPSSWSLTSKDLCRIAASCPGLQSLSIQGLLKPGADTSALLLLPECRSLAVGGRAFDNRAAAVVAQMTQLTSLRWWCAQGFDSLGVQQLAALTELQELVLVPVMPKVSTSIWADDHNQDPRSSLQPTSEMEPHLMAMLGISNTDKKPVELSSQGGMGTTVRRQLDELCDRSSQVAPLRLCRLRADNQQLQLTVGQQQNTISQLMQVIEQHNAQQGG